MIEGFKQKIKHHFREVLKTKTSSHSIALGFAIGTLIGLLPTPGFGFLLGLVIVLIFENISKYSLFAALLFWNPFVMAPVYLLSYEIGNLIFAELPVVDYYLSIVDRVYHFSRRFLIGNLILAASISVLSYFVVKKTADFYRVRKKK